MCDIARLSAYVHRTGRLRGATRMYMMQNVAVAASAAAVFPLLSGSPPAGLAFWVATCITIGEMGMVCVCSLCEDTLFFGVFCMFAKS